MDGEGRCRAPRTGRRRSAGRRRGGRGRVAGRAVAAQRSAGPAGRSLCSPALSASWFFNSWCSLRCPLRPAASPRPAPSRSSRWRWESPSPGTGSSTSTSPCPGPCSRRAWPRASRAYLTLFTLLSALLPEQAAVATAGAAAVTGLLVQPLGTRLARGADRLLYGDRSDPYAVLGRLSTALGGTGGRRGPAGRVRRGRRRAPPQLGDPDHRCRSRRIDGQARPVRRGAPAVPSGVELRHRGSLVGELAVTPRAASAASTSAIVTCWRWWRAR